MRKDWRWRGLEGSRSEKQICCISGLGCLFLGDWTLLLGSDWGCGWLDLKAADETAVERNWGGWSTRAVVWNRCLPHWVLPNLTSASSDK